MLMAILNGAIAVFWVSVIISGWNCVGAFYILACIICALSFTADAIIEFRRRKR